MKRALIALVAVTALAAAGWYLLARAPRAGAALELLSRLPGDAALYAYADLEKLRASPFLERLRALAAPAQADAEYDAFVRATGFDYTRDLDRVALASYGPAPAAEGGASSAPAGRIVVVAEGRFDRARIAAYALRSGRLEGQNGRQMYVVPGAEPGRVMAFVFLDAGRILLSDAPLGAQDGQPAELDAELGERLALVSGSAVFAVARLQKGPPVPLGGLATPSTLELLASIRWVSLAAQPEGARLRLALDADCDTPENANQLAGTVDGLRILARAALADPAARGPMSAAEYALVDGLLRDADVARDARRVRVTVSVAAAALEGLGPAAPSPAPR